MTRLPLGVIADFIRDGTHGSPARVDEGVPVLSAMNVKGGVLNFETERFASHEEFEAFFHRVPLAVGDVLLTIVGTIGRAAVVEQVRPLVFQRSVAIIRPNPAVLDSRFFYHVTQSTEFQNQLDRAANKSSQAGVYLGKLAEVLVPVPAVPEQRRIAAILDKADALRTKRREAMAQLDRLAQAIFLEMFGDPVTNPKGIEKRSLSSIAEIATGSTPSRSNSKFYEGTIPWIKTTEVIGCEIFDTEEKLTEEGFKAIRGKLHPEGSIIVAMYGQGQTRGRCGLLRVKASCNQACGVIKPSAYFDSVFMFQQLQMAYERLRALGRGGNQENLNLQLLGDFEVLVPSSALQAEYVNRSTEIHALKVKHRSCLTELHSLFTSLQQRAFSCEL